MKTHGRYRGKIIVLAAALLLALMLLFVGGIWSMFRTEIRAASSITQLTEGLYCLEYDGDYGFDEFIAQGGAATDSAMAEYIAGYLSHGFWKQEDAGIGELRFGCSTLSAQMPEGGAVYGRNYDWEAADAMIVRTKPENGYESVSTCCLPFLGFGEGWKPEGFANKFMALAAVYVPLDGMNSAGLCIADLMNNDGEVVHQDTDKPDLTTVSAIRLLLDKAATVDEALALLAQFDMNASIEAAHHLSIMDATGRAVVVEYLDNEMVVTETPAVTNHTLAAGHENKEGASQTFVRYKTLLDALTQTGGVMTTEQMRQALQSVSQANFQTSDELTLWSIVYDTSARTAQYFWQEDYTNSWTVAVGKTEEWITRQK